MAPSGNLKTVRFALEQKYYSPPCSPISPSSSTSSTSSASTIDSVGPITPPSLDFAALPMSSKSYSNSLYHSDTVAAKSAYVSPGPPPRPQLHPVLDAMMGPWFSYDLCLPPPSANIPLQTLAEPATTPAIPELQVSCPHLPWVITIRAQTRNRYVTVSDVRYGLHTSLRKNITQKEYDLLPTTRDKEKVTLAYQKRYKAYRRGSVAYQEEKRAGAKRIDFLMTSRRFAGLCAHHETGVWSLCVSR
ncbi:hypothetical protein DL96DRAFT_1586182 [Flagelloscypha sp. PMI_526]|nr:hypothetical protein DL96DRAFT_1586182 [Flagelloscypha sp. PMI_526]